ESAPVPLFACDAMLGGLARWLRAAGYDASWHPGIRDRDLVRLVEEQGCFLLTSDTGIFKFALVRDGNVPALFIHRLLDKEGQLAFVLGKLNLPLREQRCMACGGGLVEVPKANVRERAPPRSFAWKERFHECSRCGRLYWEGTHWQHIEEVLRRASGRTTPERPGP